MPICLSSLTLTHFKYQAVSPSVRSVLKLLLYKQIESANEDTQLGM